MSSFGQFNTIISKDFVKPLSANYFRVRRNTLLFSATMITASLLGIDCVSGQCAPLSNLGAQNTEVLKYLYLIIISYLFWKLWIVQNLEDYAPSHDILDAFNQSTKLIDYIDGKWGEAHFDIENRQKGDLTEKDEDNLYLVRRSGEQCYLRFFMKGTKIVFYPYRVSLKKATRNTDNGYHELSITKAQQEAVYSYWNYFFLNNYSTLDQIRDMDGVEFSKRYRVNQGYTQELNYKDCLPVLLKILLNIVFKKRLISEYCLPWTLGSVALVIIIGKFF
jgi:hypothetical protein